VLGTCPLHRSARQVHDELLLGEEHLLRAVEQTDTQVRFRLSADGSVLPVDTFHSARPGIYGTADSHVLLVVKLPVIYVGGKLPVTYR